MSDEIKKLLFDLVEYYNVMGTENDPGIEVFADITHRASIALEVQSRLERVKTVKMNNSVDPFNLFPEDKV